MYFGQDDWQPAKGVRPRWNAYLDAYRRIEERGAGIFVVSEELAERLSPRARVVPNGVIPEVWRPSHPASARITALPRPRAITRHDRRPPRGAARRAHGGRVGALIVIGHFGDASVIRWLQSLENVHVFGTVGQVELAERAATIGVIPHRDQAGFGRRHRSSCTSTSRPASRPGCRSPHPSTESPTTASGSVGATSGKTRFPRLSRWVVLRERPPPIIEEVAWQRRMRPVVDAAVGQAPEGAGPAPSTASSRPLPSTRLPICTSSASCVGWAMRRTASPAPSETGTPSASARRS